MKKLFAILICALLGVGLTTVVWADDDNPLAEYLQVPGATVTLPVSAAKDPFPPYGEDKMPGFLREAAKFLAGE